MTAPRFTRRVIEPAEAQRIAPELTGSLDAQMWVYHYTHPTEPWTLSIATLAPPQSKKLSMGGFRIAPESRTSIPGWDPIHEAIDLGIGMEEKVYWSRLIRVGGPLAQRDFNRLVGGKCVLKPTADARVGQPRDFQLLDFATECLNDCEAFAGIHVTTGQDLGHGVMSDGKTQSLDYIKSKFPGSVVADTSKPTAEGNYHVLEGMLRGAGRPISGARIGFIGCGNIGAHVLRRAKAAGADVVGVEPNAQRRTELAAEGAEMFGAEGKGELLTRPLDAVVVNAAGGSLDSRTVTQICENARIRIVCGSENLTMPNPDDSDRLRAAQKLYAPTELGGMMGYLTAVEEFLSFVEKKPFRIEDMYQPAERLAVAGEEGARYVIERDFAISFEDAMRELYGEVGAQA